MPYFIIYWQSFEELLQKFTLIYSLEVIVF